MADDCVRSSSRRSSSKGGKGSKGRRCSSRASTFSEDGAGSEEDGLAMSTTESVFDEADEDRGVSADFDVETRIAQAMDDILEKSSSVRGKGYNTLVSLLRGHVLTDFMGNRIETLVSLLKSPKRDSSEQEAAALVMALAFVQVGCETAAAFFRQARDALSRVARDYSKDDAARIASIHSLAVCCFIAGDGDGEEEGDVLFFLESLFTRNIEREEEEGEGEGLPSDAVMAAAVTAWALLLTRVPRALASEKLHEVLPVFEDFLECSTDHALTTAAGEAVALLAERCECESTKSVFHMAISSVRLLATESNKRKSKKNMKEQHSQFRNVLSFLEDGSVDAEKMTVRGEEITLNTWEDLLTAQALRSVLRKGFDCHLAENMLLRDIFGLGAPRLHARMTQEDKAVLRLRSIEEKRTRKVSRSNSRDAKAALQQY